MSGLTVEDVYHRVRGICFKTGPPRLVGIETEWLVVDLTDPHAYVGVDRLRAILAAAGPPPAGSSLTFEPGGQLELSSPPCPGVAACHAALGADIAHVARALADHRLGLRGYGVDPLRPPRRLLTTDRYACMEGYFLARGEPGLTMMCSTASVQVSVDIGEDLDAAGRRWRLAHDLGPVLVAAFANSPLCQDRPTGWRSTRQAVWSALDPRRTGPPDGADPVAAWTRYALAAPVMLVRANGSGWVADPGLTFGQWLAGRSGLPAPGYDDLDYHLSTLFPPVRPRGWFELRMIDALPEPYWPVPLAVVGALLDVPAAADTAAEAAAEVAGRWTAAARDGLTDPALARAAVRCFAAALAALPAIGAPAALVGLVEHYTDRYVARGRSPADDLLEAAEISDRTNPTNP